MSISDKLKRGLRKALVCFLLFPLAGVLQAAPGDTARVLFLRGTVTATDEATKVPRLLRKNSRLETGDVVETGPKGLAKIVFPDKSLVFLKASSILKIQEMRYEEANPEADSMISEAIKGSLRAVSGAVGKRNPDKVLYSTSVSTIGIRGTALQLSEMAEGGWVVTFDIGRGYVRNNAGIVEIAAGQTLLITSPDSLDTPSPAEQIYDFNEENIDSYDASMALWRIAMQSQLSSSPNRNIPALVQAFAAALPAQEAADVVTLAALLNPTLSTTIYEAALDGGLDVAIGLRAIIFGILNDHPEQLAKTISIAVENGLTREQAEEVARQCQDVCR
jgi:hypothetical protein